NGTPADCVAVGAHHWEHVDLVLSGLNIGLNLGNAIWHSGTLAAAKQAALLGLRGIALSAPTSAEPDFEPFKPWVRRVLGTMLSDADRGLANAPFPREPRGLLWARAAVRGYDGRITPMKDPAGRDVFWFTAHPVDGADVGTDRWAVEQRWVSITPLRLDMTDESGLSGLRARRPLDAELAAASPPKSSPVAAERVRKDEAETSIESNVAEDDE